MLVSKYLHGPALADGLGQHGRRVALAAADLEDAAAGGDGSGGAPAADQLDAVLGLRDLDLGARGVVQGVGGDPGGVGDGEEGGEGLCAGHVGDCVIGEGKDKLERGGVDWGRSAGLLWIIYGT